MKKLNSIFFVSLLVALLSSCTTVEKVKKESLLDPQKFISERKNSIDQTVALGPRIKVDLDREKKIRNNERRQINKEEKKNYINISDSFAGKR